MPITLLPVTRRGFLKTSLAAGAAVVTGKVRATEPAGATSDRVALISDTHIAEKPEAVIRGVDVAAHFRRVIDELLTADSRPGRVFHAGDCAYLDGKAAEYANFFDLARRLPDAGLPVHLLLGNHDHRQRFWEALPKAYAREKPIDSRHVALVNTPVANWFLLDSLDVTDKSPGALGETQLKWLEQALDKSADAPALVMVHHQPDRSKRPIGLVDTAALEKVLIPRKQVKALIFGHTHNWQVTQRDGIHHINLPPVAYPFAKDRPSGWIEATLTKSGGTFTLHSLDTKHRQHGQKHELAWRAA
jgi:3',5'-cyclic AMP phosphodiesterase CpdA